MASRNHPATDMYCDALARMAEDELDTSRAQLSRRLGITQVAVGEMVRRLVAADVVEVVGSQLVLTDGGRAIGDRMLRRRRLVERLLVDLLDHRPSEAHEEAAQWRHVLSETSERALFAVLGDPTTCPWGNPIPGRRVVVPASRPLAEVPVGEVVAISRVPQVVKDRDGALELLERRGLVAGATVEVAARRPDGTTTVATGDGEPADLDAFLAAWIRVVAAP